MAEKQLVSDQPQGITPMQVGGNRNVFNVPVILLVLTGSVIGVLAYSPASTPVAFVRRGCWSVWCPCVVFSKNKQRLRHLQTQGTPLPGPGETYDSQCLVYGGLDITGYSWILQISNRADLRERYGIRGGTGGDCFTSWCCRPCALTQERREIELEEGSFE